MVNAPVAGSDSARVSFSRITLSACGNQHSVVSMAPAAPTKSTSQMDVMPFHWTDSAISCDSLAQDCVCLRLNRTNSLHLSQSKSDVSDFDSIYCRTRVNPSSDGERSASEASRVRGDGLSRVTWPLTPTLSPTGRGSTRCVWRWLQAKTNTLKA